MGHFTVLRRFANCYMKGFAKMATEEIKTQKHEKKVIKRRRFER